MSLTEQKLRNAEAERFQARGMGASAEKLKPLDERIAALRALLDRPKVERWKPAKTDERDTLKAIMKLLNKHPKVGRVWRQNSGVAKYTNKDGSRRFVRANTAKGMSDIMGILKDGRTLAIEVKSPIGIVKAHQHEFLNTITKAGGLAFVARSVDDVIEQLGRFS